MSKLTGSAISVEGAPGLSASCSLPAFLPTITLVSILPMSIGGLGVRELVMIYLFSQVGVDSADILTVGLVIHALNTLLSLAGAPMMLRRRTQRAAADPRPDGRP